MVTCGMPMKPAVEADVAFTPAAGVIVGDVASTTEPLPVDVEKSERPASQSAAVVNVVPIHVAIAVEFAGIVMTAFPPDEFTVTTPVELLTMWNDQPVASVEVTGSTTVCVVVPVNTWYTVDVFVSVVEPAAVAVVV